MSPVRDDRAPETFPFPQEPEKGGRRGASARTAVRAASSLMLTGCREGAAGARHHHQPI